ncbi:MAG: cyclic nucleotide-binding domain-containing protein [Hahellaceae bacterium]|nr:cyclic nucleotide-binding domain-containing protein [Hahellaceae bacterium]
MLFLNEQPKTIEQRLSQLGFRTEALSAHLPKPDGTIVLLPRQRLWATQSTGRYYVVRSGSLYAESNQRVAYVLQAGDVAGLHTADPPILEDYFSDDPVTLDFYDSATLHKTITQSPELSEAWTQYLLALSGVFCHAFSDLTKDRHRPQAGFLRFKAGDMIIREGEEADNVYTLMKGHARVEIGEVEVGHVEEGEIFGAIAALTRSQRNASVIATESCTVMAVPKEQFAGLIEAHPETSLHLLESMARTINTLNARLAARSGS